MSCTGTHIFEKIHLCTLIPQDIFNPEFFVGAYPEIDTKTNTRRLVPHQYRDEIQAKPDVTVDLDSPDCVTFER